MTPDKEIERVLDQWLADGPTTVPDRTLAGVVDRIHHQRQRYAWRLDWRGNAMNTTVKIAAGLATVVVVALIGYNLLPARSTGIAGPGPTPSPIATLSATPTSNPTGTPLIRMLPSGVLQAGSYRMRPFASVPAMTVTLSVPAGWKGYPDWAVLGPNDTDAPDGTGIGFLVASGLFSDPCHWDGRGDGTWPQQADIAVGPTVDDLAAALRAHSAYKASTPSDVTIDGYRGKQLDLQLPSDISSCDKAAGNPTYLVWGPDIDGNDLYAQGPGNRWHLRILDVAGTRVVIVVTDYVGTPPQHQATAEAIVDSVVFTP